MRGLQLGVCTSLVKTINKSDRSTSGYIFFLSPERAATYQPRATPWVKINQYLSPVRAQHKDKLKKDAF